MRAVKTEGAIRTLIVDDEPLARRRIRRLLESEPDVDVVGESGTGRHAVAAIRNHAPDLVFLDVQMPGLSGFEVLAKLQTERLPAIIFVTAYDEYAVRAFDVHALDYLLKPFSRERFVDAVRCARNALRREASPAADGRLTALLAELRGAPLRPERLLVRTGGRVLFVAVEEIDWIEAAGNYVRLHTGNRTHLLRDTMAGIASKLDPRRFLRIHRSTIVNADRIRELQPWFHGDHLVILEDGKQLTLSRTFRDAVSTALGQDL